MAKRPTDLGGGLTADIDYRQGATYVVLKGSITEVASFKPLLDLRTALRIDLAGVERINSLGVRHWVHFVRDCEDAGIQLVIDRCSPVIVQQISMISNFMGQRAQVTSLIVPYFCPSCEAETTQVVEIARGAPIAVPPSVACPKCNNAMKLDEPAEMYESLFERRAG